MKKIVTISLMAAAWISGAYSYAADPLFLSKPETVSQTTNHLKSATIAPSSDLPARLQVDMDFEGFAAVLPGTQFASPPLDGIHEQNISLTLSLQSTGQASGTKLMDFSGKLSDGRTLTVTLECYAQDPENLMGVQFTVDWPQGAAIGSPNKMFAYTTLSQNGGDCNWGLWKNTPQ